jgi:hypothetical protein
MKSAQQAYYERRAKRPRPDPAPPPPQTEFERSTADRLLAAREEFSLRRGPIIGGKIAALWSLIPDQPDKMLPWHAALKRSLSRLWYDLPRRKLQDSIHTDVQRYVRSPKDASVQRINSEMSQWERRRHDRLSSDIDPAWLPMVVAPKDDQTGILTAHIRLYAPASQHELLMWYTIINGRLPHIEAEVGRLWERYKNQLINKSARQFPRTRSHS